MRTVKLIKEMNAVGIIGQFMINNQIIIDAILLILLAAIVIYWLAKRIMNSKKNDDALNEISKKIDRIENEVKGIADGSVRQENTTEPDSKKILESSENELVEDKNAESVTAEDATSESAPIDKSTDESVIDVISEDYEKLDDTALDNSTKADISVIEELKKKNEKLVELSLVEGRESVSTEGSSPDFNSRLESIISASQKKAKFSSRDWDEDRYGNKYNEDDLKKLIS